VNYDWGRVEEYKNTLFEELINAVFLGCEDVPVKH
jgi:hypothetical protein